MRYCFCTCKDICDVTNSRFKRFLKIQINNQIQVVLFFFRFSVGLALSYLALSYKLLLYRRILYLNYSLCERIGKKSNRNRRIESRSSPWDRLVHVTSDIQLMYDQYYSRLQRIHFLNLLAHGHFDLSIFYVRQEG